MTDTVSLLIQTIDAARVASGLSERALSLKAGKSRSHYWWFKQNAASAPLEVTLKYCECLGLTLRPSQ